MTISPHYENYRGDKGTVGSIEYFYGEIRYWSRVEPDFGRAIGPIDSLEEIITDSWRRKHAELSPEERRALAAVSLLQAIGKLQAVIPLELGQIRAAEEIILGFLEDLLEKPRSA